MSSPRRNVARGLGLAAAASLLLPTAALAQDEPAPTAQSVSDGLAGLAAQTDVLWIMVSAILVILMQAGFLFLELGFSRSKNVGAIVGKILVNFSIATVAWWVCGFGIAFGGPALIAGDSGFFFHIGQTISTSTVDGVTNPYWASLPLVGEDFKVNGSTAAFFIFQLAFCAVSLAIVWGTTIERIKFSAYVIYGIVFAAVIYPLGAHWIFGSGFLGAGEVGNWIFGEAIGMQDYAGSTAVHLIGATGGLAALLHLGPRLGKYGTDGKPRAIPGHSMPFVGFAALILLVGWFGFNAGSGLGLGSGDRLNGFAEVAVVTLIAAAAGVLAATATVYAKTRTLDVGMSANGMIAGLVAITAPAGYVEYWAAIPIGIVAGIIVVFGIYAIDKRIDDPVGALSAHGLAGIWGTISCGLFTSERLANFNAVGKPGLFQGGGIDQLVVQIIGVVIAFVLVFTLSWITFFVIKKTIGLRVSEEDERAGLDISEHGMYGYPEQFIPEAEMVGHAAAAPVPAFGMASSPNKEIPA
jgi:Amt family ammonium transporter